MLSCVDSHEIAEWMAYERAFGPIGTDYNDRALAAIHAQITQLCIMYAQVNSEDDIDADAFPSIPMPEEYYGKKPDETEEED